jgi:peroxiredoxin family protein
MPMPVPMPVMVQMLPGMESMATMMMKQKMKSKGVASLQELRDLCLEADVKFVACQMTVDLFEFENQRLHQGRGIRRCRHLHEVCGRVGCLPVHLN